MIIDIFNHFMPKAYLDRLAALIPGHVATTAFPRLKTLIDVDARLRLLDEFGDFQQVLSLANPPLELVAAPDATPDLARLANDALAEICRKHPRPLSGLHRRAADEQCRSLARREVDRTVTHLGARGIQVFTNVAGVPLSDAKFRPLFRRMAEHDLPVWVHPMRGPDFADYASEKDVAGRSVVLVRLALRDHRLHDAADLFRPVRRTAARQDHLAPYGRHDPLLSGED